MGISVVSVSAETQSYGLPAGAAVQRIDTGSPAEAAGLQVADIITQANGIPITGSSQLVSRIADTQPGDVLVLTVYRQGQYLSITVTVGEQVQSATPQQQTQSKPSYGYQDFPWYYGW